MKLQHNYLREPYALDLHFDIFGEIDYIYIYILNNRARNRHFLENLKFVEISASASTSVSANASASASIFLQNGPGVLQSC